MKALVTGGGGFLGGALVRRLVADGAEVRSLARGDYPWLRELGVDARRGDVADAAAVRGAARGCDVVFHVAAKAGVWGPRAEYVRANVEGTRNVLAACRAEGVPRLVHTSTPSVVHDGGDQDGVDESAPYAARFLCPYPETKALAEREVLAANGPGLATVALRPHLVWGPRDTHLVPMLLDRARSGRLRRVGSRPCLVDTTYVENAVDAHLAAAARLAPGAACAGRAYFVANGEPLPVSEIIDRILAAGGLPPVSRRISARGAFALGAVLEAAYRVLGRRDEPPMTRFVARQLATAHWFRLDAARRDLGWEPRVTIAEGLERLAAWLRAEGLAR